MSRNAIYALLSLTFLLLIAFAGNGATLQKSYYSGANTWDWNAKVITDSFDVSSAATFSSYLPDVDAVLISYDDQKTMTITPGWEYSTGNATLTFLGDASEDFTAIVYDFPGY